MAILVQLKNLLVFIFIKNLFKLLLVLILSLVLFVSLFPKNELSDFVSKTVAEQTNNRIKLDFENLSFSVANTMGVQLDRVFFQMSGFPPVTLKELVASPDLMAALSKKPYGKIKLLGLFSGEVEVTISKYKSEGESPIKKVDPSLISITANRVDLAELNSFFSLPMELRGHADLSAKAVSLLQLAPTLDESGKVEPGQQPFQLLEIPEVTLTVKNFEMPPFLLEKNMLMPLNVPGVKLSEIIVKGRLYENTFQIQDVQLGKPGDELSGSIKGNVTLQKGLSFFPEKYEMSIDLKMRQSFYDKIGLLLSISPAGNYLKPFSGGYSFKSKMSGIVGPGAPSFGPAQ